VGYQRASARVLLSRLITSIPNMICRFREGRGGEGREECGDCDRNFTARLADYLVEETIARYLAEHRGSSGRGSSHNNNRVAYRRAEISLLFGSRSFAIRVGGIRRTAGRSSISRALSLSSNAGGASFDPVRRSRRGKRKGRAGIALGERRRAPIARDRATDASPSAAIVTIS